MCCYDAIGGIVLPLQIWKRNPPLVTFSFRNCLIILIRGLNPVSSNASFVYPIVSDVPFTIGKEMTFMDNIAPVFVPNKNAQLTSKMSLNWESIWQVTHDTLFVFDWNCTAWQINLSKISIFYNVWSLALITIHFSSFIYISFVSSSVLIGNRWHTQS